MPRITQRNILPSAVKTRQISPDNITNTGVSEIGFSVNDGVSVSINSLVQSSINKDIRLGAVPFMFALFECENLSEINPGSNQIPFDFAASRYTIIGPLAMPEFYVNGSQINSAGTVFASDGNNLVYRTTIANNSGDPQNLFALIQIRVIQGIGGGAG